MARGIMRGFAVSAALVGMALSAIPGAVPFASAQQSHALRRVIERAVPTYPDLARRLSLHGIVRIEVSVFSNGNVKSTKVLGGNPVLAQSAIDAVRKWKFEPGPDESTEVVELRFDQK